MAIIYHIVVKNSMQIYIKVNETEVTDDSFVRAQAKSFHWAAFWGIVIRGLNHMMLITLTFLAFKYAAMAEINQGVIASLFTSGVIFTSVLFYFVYAE